MGDGAHDKRSSTDDGLKIRHVRLCQCGKLAEHDGVCRPGQLALAQEVDRTWERENSDERAEEHASRQPSFRAARNKRRARLTSHELRALADVRVAKLSPISAGNVAPSHGSALHPSVNLALQGPSVRLDSDPRWKAAEHREKGTLLRMHELLDEYEGLGVAQAEREITAEDKDVEIVAPYNEHLSASEFARDFPGYGSPGTIATKRRWFRAGLCTFSGLPPADEGPRASCRCPTCRRAVA